MSVADYLSLVRIPLGIAFVFVAGDVVPALTVLTAAGLSDVLDGWVARRQMPAGQPHPRRGDWLDPLCDKLFMASVVGGLYLARRPPPLWLALLLTREVIQVLAVTALRLVPTLHGMSRDYDFRAHLIGKLTTVVQFMSATAMLVGHPLARPLVWTAAGLGLVSVVTYVRRLRVLPKWGH